MSFGDRWRAVLGSNTMAFPNRHEASTTEDGSPVRRRRMLSRRPIFVDDMGISPPSPRLNPRAARFVPSASSPPKRKISPSDTDVQRNPIIPSDQILERAGNSLVQLKSTDSDLLAKAAADDSDDGQYVRSMLTQSWSANPARRSHGAPRPTAAVLFHATNAEHNDGSRSSKLHYLPLAPSVLDNGHTSHFTILPSARLHIDQALISVGNDSSTGIWETDKLPVEIFELITENMSRVDIKAMRLVNKEFEAKVSLPLFRTAVVPFNTELYDMIDEDVRATVREPAISSKGKGRARDAHRAGINWQNATSDHDDKVYKGHGLRVFQGFGRHIRRFGMSFEVSEEQMANLPEKRDLETVKSYHGEYDWPPEQYARFSTLAGLEKTADETSRMKAAFSNLTGVQELGLSIDSGLGWLKGSDVSIHSEVFSRPTPIFDTSRTSIDEQSDNRRQFWNALRMSVRSAGFGAVMKEQILHYHGLPDGLSGLGGLSASSYRDPAAWPTLHTKKMLVDTNSHCGVAIVNGQSDDSIVPTVVPAMLRKEQKEWLLETEWAQRAFLESYVLATIDNYDVFSKVTRLSVAKISSGLLHIIGRKAFWQALPRVADVTVCVSPDWRTVYKDSAYYIQAPTQQPSDAVQTFQEQVLNRISQLPAVRKLRIGYTDGGEHAEGMFARNSHLLPAPILPLGQSTAAGPTSFLRFRHVENLTLVNCWVTPPMLECFVRAHADLNLKVLTLDSVSLTTHPRFTVGGNAGNAGNAGHAGIQAAQWHAQLTMLQAAGAGGTAAIANMLVPQLAGQLNPQQLQIVGTIAQQQQAQGIAPTAGQAALLAHPYVRHLIANLNGAAIPNPVAAGGVPGGGLPPGNGPGFGTNPAVLALQFANNILPVPGPAAAAGGPAQPQPSHWTNGHHPGSWPDVIDCISPGIILRDQLPQPTPWEQPWPERDPTTLKKIEFISCGYAKLEHKGFDQNRFDHLEFAGSGAHEPSAWFRARRSALSSSIMSVREPYHGKIVQCIPIRELNTLLLGWGMLEGWTDREAAQAPEYDGFLPGGTGRFTGSVQAEGYH